VCDPTRAIFLRPAIGTYLHTLTRKEAAIPLPACRNPYRTLGFWTELSFSPSPLRSTPNPRTRATQTTSRCCPTTQISHWSLVGRAFLCREVGSYAQAGRGRSFSPVRARDILGSARKHPQRTPTHTHTHTHTKRTRHPHTDSLPRLFLELSAVHQTAQPCLTLTVTGSAGSPPCLARLPPQARASLPACAPCCRGTSAVAPLPDLASGHRRLVSRQHLPSMYMYMHL